MEQLGVPDRKMSRLEGVVRLDRMEPIGHAEAMALASDLNDSMLDLLRSLQEWEWEAPTDCEGWKVRDIVAHLVGWAECLTSFGELRRQSAAAVKGIRTYGDVLTAQNEFQVSERRGLSHDRLLAAMESGLPRLGKVRNRLGRVGKAIPYYAPGVGVGSGRFFMDIIFSRDSLMHRIDISRAVGRDLVVTPSDRRIIEDCWCDWANRSKADARLELSGAAGGHYSAGTGQQCTVAANGIELLRLFGGRASPDVVEIEGDVAAARRWLALGCPF